MGLDSLPSRRASQSASAASKYKFTHSRLSFFPLYLRRTSATAYKPRSRVALPCSHLPPFSSQHPIDMANVKSRIEWYAQLDTTKAPVPTESTKFHRKVCQSCFLIMYSLTTRVRIVDGDHRNHRWVAFAGTRGELDLSIDLNAFTPKVPRSTPKRSSQSLFVLVSTLVRPTSVIACKCGSPHNERHMSDMISLSSTSSSYELFSWIVRVSPERH